MKVVSEMEGAAGGRKEKWEEELEDAVESEDEDLDLSEYYFLKVSKSIKNCGCKCCSL